MPPQLGSMECGWYGSAHLYLLHNSSVHLTTIPEARRFAGRITDRMRKRWRALRNSVLSSPTHPPEITLPRTAWVQLNRLCTSARRFPFFFAQMGYGLLCGLWVWRRRSNHRTCCLPMSNPSPSPWIARPDGSGWWDNQLAAQHLSRDLVRRSSSGQKEQAQTIMTRK